MLDHLINTVLLNFSDTVVLLWIICQGVGCPQILLISLEGHDGNEDFNTVFTQIHNGT